MNLFWKNPPEVKGTVEEPTKTTQYALAAPLDLELGNLKIVGPQPAFEPSNMIGLGVRVFVNGVERPNVRRLTLNIVANEVVTFTTEEVAKF